MTSIGPSFLEVDGEPVFVVLRYDEYKRLLALASGESLPTEGHSTPVEQSSPHSSLKDLTTPATDLGAILPSEDASGPYIPPYGMIPHDVISGAVHNHWSMVRSWREYLGISQVTMAERMGVGLNSYLEMEYEFARLPTSRRERLAEALGISLEQLITRTRRLRRRDYA